MGMDNAADNAKAKIVMRLNVVLLVALTACALALVTSQHQARKLFVQIEQEQERSRNLEVEYGQLQLEQSTWGMHARIQRFAAQSLRMRAPEASRIAVVLPTGPLAEAER
jgi:cell division protein FtsL